MNETPVKAVKANPFRWLGSELVLGTLIALLSILTALSSYQGSIAGSAESDNNVDAQKVLANSNTEFLRANQDIIQDYTMYDGWWINYGVNQENTDYYYANFSNELIASMERSEGGFDEEYYNSIYADADSSYDEALTLFDKAQVFGDRGDKLQLVMLLMAVGLSFAAWASLLDEGKKLRLVFAGLSIIMLIIGVVTYLTVPGIPV